MSQGMYWNGRQLTDESITSTCGERLLGSGSGRVEVFNSLGEPESQHEVSRKAYIRHVSMGDVIDKEMYKPIMKPNSPIQADTRCIMGFSKTAPALPSLWRREIIVNIMKNSSVNTRDRARKAGVAAVGAVRRAGALPAMTERSIRHLDTRKRDVLDLNARTVCGGNTG
jgi:hypothetical protein